MLQWRNSAAIFFIALGLLSGATASHAAIPGANDPKAYTQLDFNRGSLDFNRRTMVGAYQSVGKKDPKWDAQATRFLDSMAVYFDYGTTDPAYQAQKPTFENCMALAKAATDAGCDDPLVLYCKGALLNNEGKLDEAQELLEKALPGLIERKYPPYRILSAASRLATLTDTPFMRKDHTKYAKLAWDNAIATIAAKTEDRDLRYPLQGIWPMFIEDGPSAPKLEFCKAVENSKEANPWYVELFYGKYEIEAAWEARGGGFAGTVNENGWKGFADHLAKARDHLLKAYKLHPEFPEAATQMISVAMGEGGRLNETTRDWFDKAAKAQFDYYPAYQAYEWSIYPRWGGSHQEMFRFGVECLDSGRYDTYVPYQLMKIVEKINQDSGGDFKVFTVPPVHAALRRLLTETVEKTKVEEEKNNFITYEVALDWRTDQYDQAMQLVDKYADRINSDGFALVGGWAPLAISEMRAMTSAHRKAVIDAGKNPDPDAAIKVYHDLSAKLAKDDPSQFFLHYRAKALELKKDFMAGKWVSLKADEDFTPWKVLSGDWKKEKDGTLAATAGKNGVAVLACEAEFGLSYELKAKISTPDPKAPAVWTICIGPSGVLRFAFPGIHQRRMQLTPTFVKGGDSVEVKVNDQRYEMLVNGQRRQLNGFSPQMPEDSQIEIGIVWGQPGGTVKFEDVEIHRLDPSKPN